MQIRSAFGFRTFTRADEDPLAELPDGEPRMGRRSVAESLGVVGAGQI